MKRKLTGPTILAVALLTCAAYAANEITAAITLKATKGYLDIQRSANAQWNLTNTAPNVSGLTQRIGTNTAELISVGDVATPGWAWFRNLSTNNNIAVGVMDVNTNFLEFARFAPGEYGLIPLGTNSIYGMANGATNEANSVLEKIILDE